MEGGGVVNVNGGHVDDDVIDDLMLLPPGFRFHPTDEEIIIYYLMEKVMDCKFTAKAIGEVDLNRCEPWDLPKQAKIGEKEWWFFCQRDRKYPTGMRTNRATESGYWKATGKDKEIEKGKGNLVGMKKTLVFYKGRAPKGEKTNWVMHEYRLEGKLSYQNFSKAKDEWVVCKVFHKNSGILRRSVPEFARMGSFVDHLLDSPSLPALMDLPNSIHNIPEHSSYKYGDHQEAYKAPSTSLSRASDNQNYFNVSSSSLNTQWPQMEPDYNYKFSSSHHHRGSSSNSAPKSMHFPQMAHPSSNSSYQPSSNLSHQPENVHVYNQIPVQCKMEQFSGNNSMVSISQDTGISTDVGHEISSSVISKPPPANGGFDDRPFENLECLSVAPNIISDLDPFWDY